MSTLNLVIHEQSLHSFIEYFTLFSKDTSRMKSVLERISEIKKTDPDNTSFIDDNFLIHPERFCEGYTQVILFGHERKECLNEVAEGLYKMGIPVSYDIKGTF